MWYLTANFCEMCDVVGSLCNISLANLIVLRFGILLIFVCLRIAFTFFQLTVGINLGSFSPFNDKRCLWMFVLFYFGPLPLYCVLGASIFTRVCLLDRMCCACFAWP